ncbi:Cenp-O kinetochore centromere component-domain-containing protein [Durotheca rogersii]|uniref:Cenp-O kinetochore centromere component-domain-containing protein n=1 Tax=Durotheca rogersii TaxID=419775 RepID=UPI00221F60FA|nr:Cenp-O kinetochore centromere component-domain-containing protein [Durotheca rogersii]KAI5860666.1 Cenp-O kinetochore centromere component-domain-containing protein [Durotheca rogersii]
MATDERQSPELSVADKLDHEIENLRAQVELLKQELALQTATLMASESTRQILKHSSAKKRSRSKGNSRLVELLARADKQSAHKQQCLYRACASITTFKVRDPDPNAVDSGSVLGLRFEVMSKSRFFRPYYIMLNRPYPNSRHLRVHRHTVPPCIPLSGVAARHLPPPTAKDDHDRPKKQDLSSFARTLRRELVRYHNRTAVIGDLRSSAGLEGKREGAKEPEVPIIDISAADAQAKQIRIEWSDGRSGRLLMGSDGDILKIVVQGDNGQDREAVRQLLGASTRIEDITKRMEEI